MEEYGSIQQLKKKEPGAVGELPIYPPTVVQAVYDAKTGASLEAVLAQYNNIYVQYQGSAKDTRNIIPERMRRAGMMITYMNMEGETVTERAASAVQKDNDHWGLDVNWARIDELSLAGDISVTAQGTWVINGEDTKVAARGPKGDNGLTPWLKTINNRLHYSYDNVTWEVCSEPIAAYFRWSGNKIQISRDNKTWSDLSGEFADNLRIKGYVATKSALPSSASQGDIYGVGPTYAEEDTARTNPIYRYYVRNASAWVDNGSFTSIAAGIVQDTGDSENVVMSQKAVSAKLTELGQEVDRKIEKIAVYEDNLEYIRLYKDSNDRLLWGIKKDGSIEFGKGVPTPIKKYIQEAVSNIFKDISEIEVEVGNIKENYLNLIDSKEYIRAYFDAEGKILWGIKEDGSIEWSKGIPTPIKDAFRAIYEIIANHSVDIDKSLVRDEAGNSFGIPLKYVSNNEFAYAIVDLRDKLLFGIKHDGSIFGKSFAVNSEDIVNQGLINSDSNMNRLRAKLKVSEGDDVMVGVEDSNFIFVKKYRITDAWRNYTIDQHENYITIRDDSSSVIVTSSTIFGSDIVIKSSKLVPFDYNRCNTGKNMAIMVVSKTGILRRCDITDINNALTLGNWSDCNLWEKRGTKRKIPVKSIDEVDIYHRYDTTLSADRYLYNKVHDDGYIQFQGKRMMTTLNGNIVRTKKVVAWGDYINTNDSEVGRPCLWATTDGADNIVAVYDFVEDIAEPTNILLAASYIDTSTFNDYAGGLSMYHIGRINPTKENQDPWKYSNMELFGFSIIKGKKTIINLKSHGLTNCDIVRFEGALSDNEWSQLQSNTEGIDVRSFIGDNVYYVSVIDEDSFYIKEYTGSYDIQISARHIHSVNETKAGFIFCTGEEYPCGWEMFANIPPIDANTSYDVMKRGVTVYRLNSGEMSIQRCCGFIMDGNVNPNCIAFSDTGNISLGKMAIGDRIYNLPPTSSAGIWKGKLSEIDDWTSWECVCDVPESAIWTYKVGRVIVTYWQSNGFTVSMDGGKTFGYYPHVNLETGNFCGVHNGRIVINNGYEFIPLDSVNLDGIYERLETIENNINN